MAASPEIPEALEALAQEPPSPALYSPDGDSQSSGDLTRATPSRARQDDPRPGRVPLGACGCSYTACQLPFLLGRQLEAQRRPSTSRRGTHLGDLHYRNVSEMSSTFFRRHEWIGPLGPVRGRSPKGDRGVGILSSQRQQHVEYPGTLSRLCAPGVTAGRYMSLLCTSFPDSGFRRGPIPPDDESGRVGDLLAPYLLSPAAMRNGRGCLPSRLFQPGSVSRRSGRRPIASGTAGTLLTQ
jgi:hypothetical protein